MKTGKKVKASNNCYKFDKFTVLTIILLVVIVVVAIYFNVVKPKKTTTTNSVEKFTDRNGEVNADKYYNPDREVLVVFCKMAGCGHCVNFDKNVWQKVEAELNGADTENGKKVKLMTADVNHPLSSDVSGFPTIKKYGANPADYTEFEQARTIDNFTVFCLN